MATKRSKRSEEEKLTPSNIEYVISLLEAEKPITKKDACAILNIAYNTTRLTQIITKYKEGKERTAKKRAEKRGKPLSQDEVVYIIQEYISGSTIDSISNTITVSENCYTYSIYTASYNRFYSITTTSNV